MNRIRECRQNKKLTLKQLSEELAKQDFRISADALGKYERGDREPKLETWLKLADFFDVPVTFLQGISNVSDKNIFSDLSKWLSVAGDAVDDDRVSISLDEVRSRTQELTLINFNKVFNSLIEDESTSKSDQKRFQKIKDELSMNDLLELQDILLLVRDVFKISLESLNNKKAKKAYDALYKIVFDYLGIDDEEALPQDGDTIHHKKQ